MTRPSTCGKCGTPLAGDAPEQLCPKCLIIAGLLSEIGAEAPATADFSPSDVVRAAQSPAPPQAQPVPPLLGGYRILRPLGKGGMGTVYEAEEEASGRRLALKVLSHSLDSEQARARFFREGRLAASVNHPNSVYVFGTEEIDGMPVISMELVSGGTLQELVKRKGPLPVTEAVDTILQVIAGLQAAAAGGVLHRDVKPSNCFIDADGTVKVGDFGLSISTLARRETNLTTTGAMLGTPAYSSPEQLRGDEIDSRSDIYAVGVTLYYLLAARTPFSGDNMVRLLATVLERPAESPRKLRPDMPEELSQVILRCLAKQPAQRFRSYDELRLALLPFNSGAPAPAGIGLRFLAGFVDGVLALCVVLTGLLVVLPRALRAGSALPRAWLFLFMAITYLVPILIFAIPEGLWGATLGKAMLGLRVVGLKRRVPGILRALLRVAIVIVAFVIGGNIPTVLSYVPLIRSHGWSPPPASASSQVWLFAPYVCILLLFATARRKNGEAAVQDLLSGTRVVLKPVFQTRSAAAPAPQKAVATDDGTPRVGPYHVLAEMGRPSSSGMLIGYDARLFRRVWIRQLPRGAPDVPAPLRRLTRHGRLRWLGGKRSPAENWDAYEALSGQPLSALLHEAQPWKRVRFWLTDLAEELDAAVKDQTLPATLTIDRVWITDGGRAKLLDFAAPDGAAGPDAAGNLRPPPLAPGDRAAQSFLKQLAVAALEGRGAVGADLTDYAPRVPMPLHARNLVRQIGGFGALGDLLVAFRQERDMPAEISAARRLVLLGGCVLPSLMVSVLLVVALWSATTVARQLAGDYRQLVELKLCLNQLNSLKRDHRADGMEQSLEIYMAGRFSNLIHNPQTWNNQTCKSVLTPAERQTAEQIIQARAGATQEEFNAAAERVKGLGVDLKAIDAGSPPNSSLVLVIAGAWAFTTGVPALIAAILFRGGVLLRGLGLALVTRDGVPARRWRVLARGMIVWMPAILAFTLLPSALLPRRLLWSMLVAIVVTYVGAALWSLRSTQRGVQDWIARTWMVPR